MSYLCDCAICQGGSAARSRDWRGANGPAATRLAGDRPHHTMDSRAYHRRRTRISGRLTVTYQIGSCFCCFCCGGLRFGALVIRKLADDIGAAPHIMMDSLALMKDAPANRNVACHTFDRNALPPWPEKETKSTATSKCLQRGDFRPLSVEVNQEQLACKFCLVFQQQ